MAKVKVDPDVQKLIDEYNSAYSILSEAENSSTTLA